MIAGPKHLAGFNPAPVKGPKNKIKHITKSQKKINQQLKITNVLSTLFSILLVRPIEIGRKMTE